MVNFITRFWQVSCQISAILSPISIRATIPPCFGKNQIGAPSVSVSAGTKNSCVCNVHFFTSYLRSSFILISALKLNMPEPKFRAGAMSISVVVALLLHCVEALKCSYLVEIARHLAVRERLLVWPHPPTHPLPFPLPFPTTLLPFALWPRRCFFSCYGFAFTFALGFFVEGGSWHARQVSHCCGNEWLWNAP